MEKEMSRGRLLQQELVLNRKNGALRLSEEELRKAEEYCEGYKAFLDAAKTEREACDAAVLLLQKNGFEPFDHTRRYTPGDRIYSVNRGKAVIAAVIGSEPIGKGINLTAAHIDSPRMDLKQHPLYEDNELALFKTHYYGGVKKYQWTAIPLSLHGIIVKRDGETVTVSIGEAEDDPIFCITDLLPHLAQDQMKRTLADGIKGEELNVLIGSYPFRDEDASQLVKLNILKMLHDKYGVVEADLLSAELELVPAFKARDLGLDRSMVAAYGQDDRVCAYTALTAAIAAKTPKRTLICCLTDKEETGSNGNTGLNSAYLRYFIADLAKTFGVEERHVLSNSKCLSADVNAAFDPTFPEVNERMNACYLNYGVVVTKFTGSRGKGGTSDASAEFVGEIHRMLDKNNVIWQTAELGKVDQGGGGTVAQFIANWNVDVIDVGVPVLSMHSPYEITSKVDIWSAYQTFLAFADHE